MMIQEKREIRGIDSHCVDVRTSSLKSRTSDENRYATENQEPANESRHLLARGTQVYSTSRVEKEREKTTKQSSKKSKVFPGSRPVSAGPLKGAGKTHRRMEMPKRLQPELLNLSSAPLNVLAGIKTLASTQRFPVSQSTQDMKNMNVPYDRDSR